MPTSTLDTPLFLFGLTTGVALAAASQFFINSLTRSQSQRSLAATAAAALLAQQQLEEPEDLVAGALKHGNPSTHLTPSGRDAALSGSLPALRRQSWSVPSFVAADGTLPRLEMEFTVSSKKLQTMVRHMVNEMRKGLESDGHMLKMIPSYVVARPAGDETGSYLALDLGGSNFRVCMVELRGQGQTAIRQSKHMVSDELKTGSGEALFDFFATCIADFLKSIGIDPKEKRALGFTFSFPVEQNAIDHGTLMQWNKGFACSGVLGVDVVNLLNKAMKKAGMNITATALVNDTVGTLVSHAYRDPQTFVGVILGTGTNAAYVERIADIPKWTGDRKNITDMVVNTEWGAYDEQSILPITSYDQALDRASNNPRKQILEKMISGMYLGEIVRYILVDLVSTGELCRGIFTPKLQTPYAFDTAYMSRIERDHSLELSDTKAVLENMLDVHNTTVQDRRIVKHVCELVGIRAARLSAAAVAAIITKMKRLDACTVAIDGSVYEHYPHFANRMRDALRELLGIMAENIVLEQARDGSGQGAALIAALHAK
ncbi:hexokinase [Powellomyces hirtus]|uniref:Phosphotransferase n=1 Tax=Powellomyces hirtus TaxID=109895 RepID=A0A507DUK2_9FUNG|nr:hexokinase [Powellomyces hirtus]